MHVRAIERLGKDAGRRRLPDAARPGKQVRMSDAARLNGVAQRLSDAVLPDDFVKRLRTKTAGQYGVMSGSVRHDKNFVCE